MCYAPIKSGMERSKVLSEIRKPTKHVPSDFDRIRFNSQYYWIQYVNIP